MHKPFAIVALMLALFLAACTQVPLEQSQDHGELFGATVDRTTVFTVVGPAGANGLSQSATGLLNVSAANASQPMRLITVYGINTSGTAVSESVLFNGSIPNLTTKLYANVTKIVMNQTVTGGVNVKDNATGLNITMLITGTTEAYNSMLFNGTNYAVTNLTFNTSDVDVRLATEFVLFTSCETINSGSNLSVIYYVSPDQYKWFAGAVTPAQCNGSSAKTTITDVGIGYIRLQITNGATLSNLEYVKLAYK